MAILSLALVGFGLCNFGAKASRPGSSRIGIIAASSRAVLDHRTAKNQYLTAY
jgi:hypothetical protein